MEATAFCCNILKPLEEKNRVLMKDGTDSTNLEGYELPPSEETSKNDEGC